MEIAAPEELCHLFETIFVMHLFMDMVEKKILNVKVFTCL